MLDLMLSFYRYYVPLFGTEKETENYFTYKRAACKTLSDSERRKTIQASNDIRERQLAKI